MATVKLGDVVSAVYGDVTVEATVDGFVGRDILIVLSRPADLGFRVAPIGEGLCVRRGDITAIVTVGPALTEADVLVSDEIGGTFLRTEGAL